MSKCAPPRNPAAGLCHSTHNWVEFQAWIFLGTERHWHLLCAAEPVGRCRFLSQAVLLVMRHFLDFNSVIDLTIAKTRMSNDKNADIEWVHISSLDRHRPLHFGSDYYPQQSLKNREQGMCTLTFFIEVDGTVPAAQLLKSSGSHALGFAIPSCSAERLANKRRSTCPFHIHNPVRIIKGMNTNRTLGAYAGSA
jgi:hypothetical protein